MTSNVEDSMTVDLEEDPEIAQEFREILWKEKLDEHA